MHTRATEQHLLRTQFNFELSTVGQGCCWKNVLRSLHEHATLLNGHFSSENEVVADLSDMTSCACQACIGTEAQTVA